MKGFLSLLHILLFTFCCSGAAAQDTGAKNLVSFEDQLVQANVLFKQGKLEEALAAVQAAQKLDPKRYEAPATAALILHVAGKAAEAKSALDAALKLAPADKQEKLQHIAKLFASTPATGASPTTTTTAPNALTGPAGRQLDALALIIEEADKAKLADERKKLLREFMGKSAEFIVDHPFQTNVWVLRAAVALELDYPGSGWLAGKRLKELGLEKSNDPKIRKIVAMLDGNGWLGEKPKDREWWNQTMKQRRDAAENGDEEAQLQVASLYRSGIAAEFPKDEVQALKWYRRAAEQGSAYAQQHVGSIYSLGDGVPKDTTEAVKWDRKAAEQGDASAQYCLGLAYASGHGVPQDTTEAVKWYRQAAEQGYAFAQDSLGRMYARGDGVPKDTTEAMKWYRKAAEQGEAYGQAGFAWRLATSSDEAIRNGKEAVQWATKACESTRWTNELHIDTLAAAHAEGGNFGDAVKYAEMAIKKADPAKDADFIKRAEDRLKLYMAHQPYRDE